MRAVGGVLLNAGGAEEWSSADAVLEVPMDVEGVGRVRSGQDDLDLSFDFGAAQSSQETRGEPAEMPDKPMISCGATRMKTKPTGMKAIALVGQIVMTVFPLVCRSPT